MVSSAIEFQGKTTLQLNGGGGSDQFSLNNPVTPLGLTSITVDGGDPTAGSDTAIISGLAGADDTIVFAPSSDDNALVTGAGPVSITLAGIENAVIDGQGGNDELTYASPTGIDLINVTPVGNGSAASVDAVQLTGATLLPLSFTDLFNVSGNLLFTDASGIRADRLTVFGNVSNDRFTVGTLGDVQAFDAFGELATPIIETDGVTSLRLDGLDGDDQFDIVGNHPFKDLLVEGGNPDGGSDVLNFIGDGGDVTIDTANTAITENGFGAVNFSGIESVHADVNGALTVEGTDADDIINVTPTADGDDGAVHHSGAGGVRSTTPIQLRQRSMAMATRPTS